MNVFSQDCNGGIIAATWSRPQCCYKVTVFKCINGEYARTGQVSGNFPRCDFGACFLKNGFIFFFHIFFGPWSANETEIKEEKVTIKDINLNI